MHRFSFALAAFVVGCSASHNNLRYCDDSVSARPNVTDLACATGEELYRVETQAFAMQQCLAAGAEDACVEGYGRSTNEAPPFLLEHCRAVVSTQSLYAEYCAGGIEYIERTTRDQERIEIDVVNDRGAGHGLATFPARCAYGREPCGPGRVEYTRAGITMLRGTYGANGQPDGEWIVRGQRGAGQFVLQNGNGSLRDVLRIEEMTCKDGLVDGTLRLRSESQGQAAVILEAHFHNGRAHGLFHTTLNEGSNVYDLALGQYTEGVPSGRWVIESHGSECALEEGNCAIVCVEYVRNGPALYEYRGSDRMFVRTAGEVVEPFRLTQRIETAPFGADEIAEPAINLEPILNAPLTCLSVIQGMSEADSPGIRIEFLRMGGGGTTDLMRMLQSRP